MDRETGNGAVPYAWTVDAVARERLDTLAVQLGRLDQRTEERLSAHETRLDLIEDDRKRRKGRIDDAAGLAKAVAWVLGLAATAGGAVLAWLNYARH